MRFWIIIAILVYGARTINGASRTITNEDIRDAILSVVNMIRSTEDKLERHEFRERTLGDQMKKVLSTIDKRQRLFDPVKGTVGRLDERLATVETILLQRDERERIQVQKVYDMVEQIHRSLPQLFETLKNDITSSLGKDEENTLEPPSKVDLEKLQKEIEVKIDNASSTVKSIEGQLTKIREENKNNFSSNQKFFEQYDNKLKEYNKQIDVIPTKCKKENDLQTNVILKALTTQNVDIKKLQTEINVTNAAITKMEEKLTQMREDYKHNHKLNASLEDVKKHMNDSHEVLKKYETKLTEYNDKIGVLPTSYKNETDAQTKLILKAIETQNTNIKQLQNEIDISSNRTNAIKEHLLKIQEGVLKECETCNIKIDALPKKQTDTQEKINKALATESQQIQNLLNKQTAKLEQKLNDGNVKAADNSNILKNIQERLKENKKSIEDIAVNKIIKAIADKEVRQNDVILGVLNKHINQSQEENSMIIKAVGNVQSIANETRTRADNATVEILKMCGSKSNEIKKALETQTNNVKKLEQNIENKTISSDDSLKTIQKHLEDIHQHNKIHRNISDTINHNINNTHQLLDEYNKKLGEQHMECNDRNNLKNVLQVLENHNTNTTELQKDIQNRLEKIGADNKKILDVNTRNFENLTKQLNDNTLNKNELQEFCRGEFDDIKNVTNNTYMSVKEIDNKFDSNINKLQESMKVIEELTDNLNGNIAGSFEKLIDEIHNLAKLEEILVQTGDSVTDTKRRVEYGVLQISSEISGLIKSQAKDFNIIMNSRFDNLESLLDTDDGVLANLTVKIAKEVDQVWRQMGMMHREMTATTEALNKLQSQDALFVNGTKTTMDDMKGKVGKITSRVMEVDNNLNTLLGRLSLMTQEFNQIKKSLGNAFDEIKSNFQTVQNKIKPTGTGPFPIDI